ncbi:MAG: hypothetical protein DYH15_11720 [Nitrosomonas sp. PRO4]|nr:hypothetical protein [Nitrosomonas sp. PRO4]
MKIKSMIAGSILILSMSSFSLAGTYDKDVELSSIPQKVLKTINQHAQGGRIERIERETSDGKFTVYEVEVKKADGKEFEFKVDENGTVISAN